MKQGKTHEDLANDYILLEDEFNLLNERIKKSRNKAEKASLREKKKKIRVEQGLIFNELKGTGWNRFIQERLGLGAKGRALARRAKRKDL